MGFIDHSGFQSLTGRLKTAVGFQVATVAILFQSLTGRLKTEEFSKMLERVLLFQSLTGRLKTACRC